MKKIYFLSFFISLTSFGQQTNIFVSSAAADNVLKGTYNPTLYSQANPVTQPDLIFQGIEQGVNPDSLKAYIIGLANFKNRNSGSDTLSTTFGFGASRTWVFNKFVEFSSQSENRLIPAYLQFDQSICGMSKHKNVMAVLPGTDTSNHQVLLIEGHMDSRCDVLCDVNCDAEGVEDNASGTALVMELARVMSKYSFKNTIVFMVTTAEEQGLFGANAFATYVQTNNIPLKAVLNNDVIGGIACGQTSSPPSCPGLNNIDSTQVRLFSSGSFNSPHKQLSRFIKLQYTEELKPLSSVPMLVTIMSAEDRTGRGGDHIPFRQKGYPAMRFTSANEHGDASNGPGYSDRQHTSDDILGVDTNSDLIIDSFFVDFNYLARNAKINGTAAGVAAMGVKTPGFTLQSNDTSNLSFFIDIESLPGITQNRVAIRSLTNDWDTVYTITGNYAQITPQGAASVYYVSVAAVNQDGIESLFSYEKRLNEAQLELDEASKNNVGVQLLQNRPNPFDEATFVGVLADQNSVGAKANIRIFDVSGKEIKRFDFLLEEGMNEILYEHGYGQVGTYIYTLEVNGKIIDSKKMIFAN